MDAKTQAAARIVHQIVTTDHRAALTDAQRANDIQQMLLAEISASKVAEKLAVRGDTVEAVTMAAAGRAGGGLTLRLCIGLVQR